MTSKNWIKRMRLINSFLPKIEEDFEALDDETLIKECIRPNIPRNWLKDFEMMNGRSMSTIKEVLQILTRIEKWEDSSEKPRDRKPKNPNHKDKDRSRNNRGDRDKSKEKNEKSKGNISNPCKLPGHKGHPYADCFNNPNSKNFKGTTKNFKDYNADGTKKNKGEEANQIKDKQKGTKRKAVSWSDDSDSEESNMMKGQEKSDKALSAELLVSIPIKEGSSKSLTVVALFDTGTSKSLIDRELIDKVNFSMKNTDSTVWETQAGTLTTKQEVKINSIRLP